jgi:hypothetical protein
MGGVKKLEIKNVKKHPQQKIETFLFLQDGPKNGQKL